MDGGLLVTVSVGAAGGLAVVASVVDVAALLGIPTDQEGAAPEPS